MQKTSDISDQLHPNVQYLDPVYCGYGAKIDFYGMIHTIKCFEDNSLVRETLDTDGQGRVLVVDGGGSKRCAMLGDQLAEKAVKNNWSGVVVYGLIRDSEMINKMPIGVRALGTHPLKSIKKGVGEAGISVSFSGVDFIPGDYLYADQDGVIVVKELVLC
ncbi:ribonuclease E activity regulator RraA [Candidatus Thioglobus autotrophicus]|jgi:regulator of ribonuclease activity A|uniref:ribonuclease E activity regulator RraA n=1 Tax=Candidatus Thioglobus autotrophicus TaxID=1705394 RepID=UPI00299DD622|nr:ribonuclease E activity regulator RraA [Candidatus Thioglobus autotrophicus]WPE17657.1 ribonuclease E activity regulator RraA [Candidatus Thioglobus autotrophicus]